MINSPVSTAPVGEEFQTLCNCCGRPIFWGHGWLDSASASLAAYWYQWSVGHPGRFALAIARFDKDEHLIPGVTSVVARISQEAIQYSIVDRDEINWPEFFNRFGPILSREIALANKSTLFELVDAITAHESRLSSRILATR